MKKLILVTLALLATSAFSAETNQCIDDCLAQMQQADQTIDFELKTICAGLCQENDFSICIEAELLDIPAPEFCAQFEQ